MAKPPLRLILFDIDGTLLLSGPMIRDLFRSVFEEIAGAPGDLDGIGFAGRTDRGIFRAVWDRSGGGDGFEERFRRFAERFEQRMRKGYPAADGPHLLPGVPALLRALEAEPTALAVATGNLRATAHVKLARFGLEEFFPVGGYGDEHEERQGVFRAALEAAREHYGWSVGARSVWLVGDTVADVEAAKQIGARVLAVATGPEPAADLIAAGADAVLPDLGDTRRVLRLLEGGKPGPVPFPPKGKRKGRRRGDRGGEAPGSGRTGD